VDLNPKDHNCQGVILLEPESYHDNTGNFLGTTCYVDVDSKSYSLPAVVFFGYTFYGAGNWQGRLWLPKKHGCSIGEKTHILWLTPPPP
jgi:hypothetical protein